MTISPFFIVGTGRCGTNLLREMLETNKHIRVIPETHFIPTLYDKFGLEPIEFDDFYEVIDNIYAAKGYKWIKVILRDAGKEEKLFQQQFRKFAEENIKNGTIKDYIESLYMFLYDKKNYIIGDKSPHYGTVLNIILKIWPESKVIHLTRDPITTALSMTKHSGFKKYIYNKTNPENLDRIMYRKEFFNIPENSITIEESLIFWQNVLLETLNKLKNVKKQNLLTVKYEDIVLFPHKTISKISDFLGIDSNKKWLNKAIQIPRPFPEKKMYEKSFNNLRDRYYSLIHKGIEKTGYPYDSSFKRNQIECVKEMYRGRYYYLSKINPISLFKKLVKILFSRWAKLLMYQ